MKCPNCNTKNEIVQIEWIGNNKIIVEGFYCKECHQLIICKVTDNALRIELFKEFELFNEMKEIKQSINKHMKSEEANSKMTKRIIAIYQNKLQNLDTQYKEIKRANTIRNKQLIKWYEQERSLNGR